MKITGKVMLKKIAPEGAVFSVSIEGAGYSTICIPVKEGQVVGKEGTVTVDIPDPKTQTGGK